MAQNLGCLLKFARKEAVSVFSQVIRSYTSLSFPPRFCTCSWKGAHNVHSGANRFCFRQSLSPEWRRPLQDRLVPGTFSFFSFFLSTVGPSFPFSPIRKKKKNGNRAEPETGFQRCGRSRRLPRLPFQQR